MEVDSNNVLSLDVGERRIGVARASLVAGIAQPLTTLQVSEASFEDIRQLVKDNEATTLVIGLPRGLDGQDTAQTAFVREFAEQLSSYLTVKIVWQDEALTSKRAEAELEKRGKKYQKADVDALAATYILEDYLADNRQKEPHAV